MTLPGFVTCPTCGGRPYFIGGSEEPCPDCVAGQVPSPETVERVAEGIIDRARVQSGFLNEDDGSHIMRSIHREEAFDTARAALLEYARHVQEGEK